MKLHFESFLLVAVLAVIKLATAQITTPPFPSPITSPPPGESYVTGYPLCGIPGFTEVPGNYTETTEQQSGSDLKCCIDQCRSSGGACKSIAFNTKYTECLFFDQIVEGTQLYEDNDSGFVHYDLPCYID